ncbi:MAG TPA: dihydroorotase [Flavisolibacter sp.]|nr:dihydroorotase [Flavisolibacter sp.]
MDIVLKGATIVDPSSPFFQQTKNIFIQAGFIVEINDADRKADATVDLQGLSIAPGFVDIFSDFSDPGFEYRETLESGAASAGYGGYTNVFVLPNTNPVCHHKAGVEYIMHKGHQLPVSLFPIGAITKGTEGKELSEMYDMHQSGAVAFSDGLCPLQSPGILLKALQYLKAINKTVIQLPNDRSISAHGLINEGVVSTRLGLPGIPAMAEELMIVRDIELANYTGGSLHITGISTAKSVQLIREAKQEGINVSCSVTPYHLLFTDENLADYDTNLKLSPPLRKSVDRDALKVGLMDGTIDCVASHHLPQHTDNKVVEFEYAKNGMIGLETCFSVVRTAMPELPLEKLVNCLAIAPRKIFGLPPVSIQPGQPASLSLFLPDEEWTPDRFYSKSKNSAFLNKPLRGKPLGIIHKEKLFLRP